MDKLSGKLTGFPSRDPEFEPSSSPYVTIRTLPPDRQCTEKSYGHHILSPLKL